LNVSFSVTGRTITLPNATSLDEGHSYVILNTGGYTFSVLNQSGALLGVINSNGSADFKLLDNSTTDGTWNNISGTLQAPYAKSSEYEMNQVTRGEKTGGDVEWLTDTKLIVALPGGTYGNEVQLTIIDTSTGTKGTTVSWGWTNASGSNANAADWSQSSGFPNLARLDDNTFICGYMRNDASTYFYPYYRICTVSGTTITVGSEVQLSTSANYEEPAFNSKMFTPLDSSGSKVFAAYRYATSGGTHTGWFAVGTRSGTSISWGSPINFATDLNNVKNPVVVSSSEVHVFNGYGSYNQGSIIDNKFTISGTSLTRTVRDLSSSDGAIMSWYHAGFEANDRYAATEFFTTNYSASGYLFKYDSGTGFFSDFQGRFNISNFNNSDSSSGVSYLGTSGAGNSIYGFTCGVSGGLAGSGTGFRTFEHVDGTTYVESSISLLETNNAQKDINGYHSSMDSTTANSTGTTAFIGLTLSETFKVIIVGATA
jgi:hypothetical protein